MASLEKTFVIASRDMKNNPLSYSEITASLDSEMNDFLRKVNGEIVSVDERVEVRVRRKLGACHYHVRRIEYRI